MVTSIKITNTVHSARYPRMPCPDGKRQFETVASNSWSKRQTSFLLKKDDDENVWLTMNIAHVALGPRI